MKPSKNVLSCMSALEASVLEYRNAPSPVLYAKMETAMFALAYESFKDGIRAAWLLHGYSTDAIEDALERAEKQMGGG